MEFHSVIFFFFGVSGLSMMMASCSRSSIHRAPRRQLDACFTHSTSIYGINKAIISWPFVRSCWLHQAAGGGRARTPLPSSLRPVKKSRKLAIMCQKNNATQQRPFSRFYCMIFLQKRLMIIIISTYSQIRQTPINGIQYYISVAELQKCEHKCIGLLSSN